MDGLSRGIIAGWKNCLVFGERKKRSWSEISKPYAASTTTAYQLGAKIRFSPNKCGYQSTLTTGNLRLIDTQMFN